MKKIISATALLIAASAFANAATALTLKISEDAGHTVNDDVLDVSSYGYFWNLQDSTGATRPDKASGNAWAGVAQTSETTKDSDGSVYKALTTSGNTDYSIAFDSSMTSFTLNSALYLDSIDGSSAGSTYTINLGENGSITTSGTMNFGTGVKTAGLTISLTETDVLLSSAGRTLFSAGDFWNLSDAKLTLSVAGFTSVGVVGSVDKISAGQVGLVIKDSKTAIAYAVAAIPEPSAFGLLAGIGALALAISRRKRRKN